MKTFPSPYQYSCRECPIRQRCIDDKSLGPGIKLTIKHRFENRTDTIETWGLLQQDCLRLRKDEPSTVAESRLLKRLRDTQQMKNAVSTTTQPSDPWIERKPATPTAPSTASPVLPSERPLCGLTVLSTQRMVRLPVTGEVVVGRFEHGFAKPPDVDLAFDDGEIPSVSRRHALFTGRKGGHWIEDMGSGNGTYVNGRKLALGESTRLEPSNRILLGRCRLAYEPLPNWALGPDPHFPHTSVLVVTHTGYQIELPEKREMMVGRPDPDIYFTPDIDLTVAGEMAMYVSRRHARLITRGNLHFLEEVGSAAGTRLNGFPIRVGETPVLLHPGDQLWFGGCVVAYEWKLH